MCCFVVVWVLFLERAFVRRRDGPARDDGDSGETSGQNKRTRRRDLALDQRRDQRVVLRCRRAALGGEHRGQEQEPKQHRRATTDHRRRVVSLSLSNVVVLARSLAVRDLVTSGRLLLVGFERRELGDMRRLGAAFRGSAAISGGASTIVRQPRRSFHPFLFLTQTDDEARATVRVHKNVLIGVHC